jgi:hypothetical protein
MDTNSISVSKRRRIAGTVLISLASIMLIGSSGTKFAHLPQVVSVMGPLGFDGSRLMIVAFLEFVSAVLFLVPVTRSLGLLLASAFMGGAIATHMQHGVPVAQPAIFLAFIWAGAWLRHPELLWSLSRASAAPRFTSAEQRAGVQRG